MKLVVRPQASYHSDPVMIRKLSKIFMEAKTKKSITNNGININTNSVITNLTEKKYNENIFQSQKKDKGGKIFLLVDSSGSMRGHHPQVRNFCYNLFSALEKYIQIEIICFSCDHDQEISCIQHIKRKEECMYVVQDECNVHDHLGLALENLEKYILSYEGKKAVFVITDGIPEARRKHKDIPTHELVERVRKSMIRLENNKVKFFALFIRESSSKKMIELFKNNYYQDVDFEKNINKLVNQINIFLRSI